MSNIARISSKRRLDFTTVYYEGGLGSQILSHIHFLFLQRSGLRTYSDLSYFKSFTRLSDHNNDLSIWDWELDDFGISFERIEYHERSKIAVKLRKLFFRKPSIGEILSHFNKMRLLDQVKMDLDEFKIDEIQLVSILNSYNLIKGEYIAIHLRKGDYLKVASRVLETKEIIDLVPNLKRYSNLPVIIFSDSDRSSDIDTLISEIEKIGVNSVNFTTANDLSPVQLHSVLRFAKVLVASNSTFSFTAGILSETVVNFWFPSNFYGETAFLANAFFTRNANWSLLIP